MSNVVELRHHHDDHGHDHPDGSHRAAIQLDNLTIAYDRHPVVHHLSGQFPPGSLTALIGPNGAGKSTLLKAIAGLLPVSSGSIVFGNCDRKCLAYLPQAVEVDRTFPLSVIDVVDLGHWRATGAFRRIAAKQRAVSRDAIKAVGLAGLEHEPISHLSVGQFQRVLFARLMVQDTPIILLDEPFNAVDAQTINDLMDLVRHWHRQGRTVIAALHDLDLVRENFTHTLLMAREPICWGETKDCLTEANLNRARARAKGWTVPAEICHRVI